MKLRYFILSIFMVFVMAGASLAGEVQDSNEAGDSAKVQQDSQKYFFREMIPWNMYIGGATLGSGGGFAFGADWIFGDYNLIYTEFDDSSILPSHIWLWSIGTHAFFSNGFNFLLQPNILYFYERGVVFKFSVGPELGYINETGFDYGFSTCIGTLLDMLNVRIGYLVRTESLYFHVLFNIPTGIGLWV